MSISTDVNDFLTRSGAPSVKFPNVGDKVKGTILGAEKSQQTDIHGAPKTYDDGNPMMQVVITLQTDERDPSVDGDTGERRLFAKGQMLTAIREALRNAGASGLEVGATLAVQYEKDGERKAAGFNPPKLYRAQYQAPAPSAVGVDDLI